MALQLKNFVLRCPQLGFSCWVLRLTKPFEGPPWPSKTLPAGLGGVSPGLAAQGLGV